jgi:trk system potassium uptake protein TrkH
MLNIRIIARVFSQGLIIEAVFMLITAGTSWFFSEPEVKSFLFSAIITLVTGVLVFTPLRNEEKVYGTREGFIIITCIWLLFSIFGTLPYLLSSTLGTFTDAFFESLSGFTTTGASTIGDVESLPRGILFWRSLTQWLGGLAIITLSFYVLPVIKRLNIHLSLTEFSGKMTDKIHPKIIETTKRLVLIFVFLTFCEILLLVIGGMPLFDAICHSMSTMSTGGFSTRNNGVAAFSSPFIRVVITLFMFCAGTNLTVFYYSIKGNLRKVIRNSEFLVYIIMIFFFSVLISLLISGTFGGSLSKSLTAGFFNTISIITTTGFYSENFNQWGDISTIIILLLMFTGGMAGSASGGIKIIRLMVTAKNSRNESARLIHPMAYMPVRIEEKIVPQNTVYNILIFIILYMIILSAGTLVFSFLDYDITTSFSTAASMLGNIGPGLGSFGPLTTYADMPSMGKWVLCILMLLGRLELMAVIILFTGGFYRN